MVQQPGDKLAVDLEKVGVETLEVGQRRVASAEVVDMQPHVEVLQRRQRLAHHGGGIRQQALGQLELEAMGLQTRFREYTRDKGRQVDLTKEAAREVDAHGQPGL
jgi:hypothetical protein